PRNSPATIRSSATGRGHAGTEVLEHRLERALPAILVDVESVRDVELHARRERMRARGEPPPHRVHRPARGRERDLHAVGADLARAARDAHAPRDEYRPRIADAERLEVAQ